VKRGVYAAAGNLSDDENDGKIAGKISEGRQAVEYVDSSSDSASDLSNLCDLSEVYDPPGPSPTTQNRARSERSERSEEAALQAIENTDHIDPVDLSGDLSATSRSEIGLHQGDDAPAIGLKPPAPSTGDSDLLHRPAPFSTNDTDVTVIDL
jgi:hypothetical protein